MISIVLQINFGVRPSWILSELMNPFYIPLRLKAELSTNELTLNFLLQLVLPSFSLVIRENTANRIGENTKSKRHQKTNSAFHLFHSVFIKSRPYHLRLISVSTTGWVKICGRNAGKRSSYIVLMWSYQALPFLIQATCNLMPKKYIIIQRIFLSFLPALALHVGL